jgi:ABC-type sugar transport system permease subunit
LKKEQNTKKTQKKSFYDQLSYQNKRTIWGILFLLPWAVGIVLFFLGPLLKTFYYAFFDMTLDNSGFIYKFIKFDNFKYALTINPEFNQNVLEALVTVLKNVPIQIFVSLFVAMLLNGNYKGRGLFRLVFFIPIILATGIMKIELSGVRTTEETSQTLVNANAIISIITSSGIPYSVIAMILEFVDSIFEVITTAGVQMLIFLAGLQGISPSLYEVAKIEGCSQFECFCKITLPMISPMILVCLIYSLADSFALADVSETISTVTFTSAKYGLGASMSAIYFMVSVIVILVISFLVSRRVFYYDK